MSFAVKPVFQTVRFSVGSYLSDDKGRLVPAKPTRCPYSESSVACHISQKGHRGRKTGPCHPLYIFQCHIHGHCFTIYPFGYTPFGRQPVWQVDLPEVRLMDLKPTYFSAVIDGVGSVRWPEGSDPELRTKHFDFKGVFKTQKRHINGACSLLGIDSELSDEIREDQSALTGVPFLIMRDHEVRVRDGPSFKKKVAI